MTGRTYPNTTGQRLTGLARKAARANRKEGRHEAKVRRAADLAPDAPDVTYWRGAVVQARQCKAIVAKVADDSPHAFQAPLAGMTLKVVEVKAAPRSGGPDENVYLYNEDGAGWDFVTKRQGKGHVPVAIIIERVVEE